MRGSLRRATAAELLEWFTKRRWARQGHMLTGRCTCNADEPPPSSSNNTTVVCVWSTCTSRLHALTEWSRVATVQPTGVLGLFVRAGAEGRDAVNRGLSSKDAFGRRTRSDGIVPSKFPSTHPKCTSSPEQGDRSRWVRDRTPCRAPGKGRRPSSPSPYAAPGKASLGKAPRPPPRGDVPVPLVPLAPSPGSTYYRTPSPARAGQKNAVPCAPQRASARRRIALRGRTGTGTGTGSGRIGNAPRPAAVPHRARALLANFGFLGLLLPDAIAVARAAMALFGTDSQRLPLELSGKVFQTV
jgi:hypothetical protein